MKLGAQDPQLDAIDLKIIRILQANGRIPLVKLAAEVGLSAPSVIERVKKLEDSRIIMGYHALVDARRLGKDIAAFIGVSITYPRTVGSFERHIEALDDVLECHHVTGRHTVLLKIKTANTASLEELISAIRSIDGVIRTETMLVLSTHTERGEIRVEKSRLPAHPNGRRHRHSTLKPALSSARRT